jgi:EEF1A N-terminal glycine/lysine methyltransferase
LIEAMSTAKNISFVMPSLTDLIRIIPPDRDEEPEDIFAFAPGFLFTDDLRVQHGDPGSVIVYKSRRFGDIELRTTDPEVEDERQLFSHYLWNAGIKMAELISGGEEKWKVQDEKVLELGAGADG